MIKRIYNVLKRYEEDDGYLYEIVESGGQMGIRCRKYIEPNDLFNDVYNYNLKYRQILEKFISYRYPIKRYKFESIVWCWPYDAFNENIGKTKAKSRVIEKINKKKLKIFEFIVNFKKHNIPKSK